jgi:hypothetical protein
MSEDISAAIEWANEYGPGASVNNYPAVLVKALTESRREVEEAKDFVYKMNPSPMYVMTALAELVEHRKHQFASGLNIYAWKEKAERLEAENATLRQEVERLDKALDKYRASKKGWAWQSLDDWEKAVEARLAPLRRQVEEQAAKLAEATKYCRDGSHTWLTGTCRKDGKPIDPAVLTGLREFTRAEQAEESLAAMQEQHGKRAAEVLVLSADLAAAQERIKELEERLPHYHNEKQCGVIAERIERAESSLAAAREREDNMRVLKEDAVKDAERAESALAAMTRERDWRADLLVSLIDWADRRWKGGDQGLIKAMDPKIRQEAAALRAERDAALSRAEAAEQERDEFSRQLVWRQSDGERKLREHIDEARLIAARSGFCYYCQASEGAAHAEFCRAFPTPPESEATRLRRQVEEQAAKLEVHERGIREASAMYNAEKQYRERAESSLAAAQEQVKALAAVNVINAALDKDLGDRNHDLALAMDALAAMTRERDQAREIGESERLSKMRREEDLAAIRTQSRREREALEALTAFYKLYENSGNWRNRGEYGKLGSILELDPQEVSALGQVSMRVDAALSLTPEAEKNLSERRAGESGNASLASPGRVSGPPLCRTNECWNFDEPHEGECSLPTPTQDQEQR